MSQVAYQSTQTASLTAGTGSQSLVITKPASLAVGDLMIAQIQTSSSSATPSLTPPSGWTLAHTSDGTFFKSYVYYKLADAADVAASNFSWLITVGAGNAHGGGSIHRYTGVNSVAPVNAVNHGFASPGGASATALSSSGITPTAQCLFLILVSAFNTSALRTTSGYAVANNNPSWTERLDSDLSVDSRHFNLAMADGSDTSLLASGNASATASGGQDEWTLTILALTPESVRPTIFGSTFGVFVPMVPTIVVILGMVSTVLTPVVEIIQATWKNNFPKHDADWHNEPKS